MSIFKKSQEQKGNEQVATRIAGHIVRWQKRFAALLNSWVNRYSKRQQKYMLCFFCLGWIILVAFNYFIIKYHHPMGTAKPYFFPGHIGQASGELIIKKPVPQTDSLTLKIKSNGEARTKR